MEKWLSCRISPGQFTGEFAVQGEMSDLKEFSLFAPEKYLQFDEKPQDNKSVPGRIRVFQLAKQGDHILVALPQSALESGQTITVKANQIK